MGDLISRQAAIVALSIFGDSKDPGNKFVDGVDTARKIILDLPDADVPKPTDSTDADKHGKWYKPYGTPRCSYKFFCSVCGGIAYQVTGINGRKDKSEAPKCTYDFCPNCGARMDETFGLEGDYAERKENR